MKTKLIIASVFTALSLTIISNVFVSANNVKEVAPTIQTTQLVQTPEPVKIAPVTVSEAPQQALEQNVSNEPVVITISPTEALLNQYGWNNETGATIIASYEKLWAEYFTDENRERSFAYIDKVSRVLASQRTDGTPTQTSLIKLFDTRMNRNGWFAKPDNKANWLLIGEYTGVTY